MLYAFDTITQRMVSAENVSKNNIDEPFRYECLCCGEQVHIAAKQSRKKSPHFRHLRGNSDRDCELYLGRLLQIGTEIESAVAAAQKRPHSRTDILFDIKQQTFFLSVSFSEEKIAEYQDGEYELDIKTGADQSIKPVLISKSNFAPDAAVRFPLKLTSNSCYLMIRSGKCGGKLITYQYDILKPDDFPTFFKIQSSDDDTLTAKRHTDGIIYNETRYYLIASKKRYIEDLLRYSPDISIGEIAEITAYKITFFGAEIVINRVSAELRDTLEYFGYCLKKAERVTILWPPCYSVEGELQCGSNKIFLTSTFQLRPRSNITCDFDQLSNTGELYAIDYPDTLRISQDNINLQISHNTTNTSALALEPKTEHTTIVEAKDGQLYYLIGKCGYQLLPPGRYHLTESTRIVHYLGNYQISIFVLPEKRKTTPIKRLMDVRKYYNVMMPYSDDLIDGIRLSKVAEIYVEDCRKTGIINTKALEYIKAGII